VNAPPDSPPCLHREDPVRTCIACGAYLTSANEDEACSLHGGWSVQRHLEEKRTERRRIERLHELAAAA
jgi:hypothetical protein